MDKIRDVCTLETALLDSVKNANRITELFNIFEKSSDFSTSLRALQAIRVVLSKWADHDDSSGKFAIWLSSVRDRYVDILMYIMCNDKVGDDNRISLVALVTLLNIAKSNPSDDLISQIVLSAITSHKLSAEFLQSFISKFMIPYLDVKVVTLQTVLASLSSVKSDRDCTNWNAYHILVAASEFRSNSDNDYWVTNLKRNRDGSRVYSSGQVSILIEKSWMALLDSKRGVSTDMYKRILMKMESCILPSIPNPLKLSDFLLDSYDLGGIISLLSLNGIFVLMTEHGFEFEQFYQKLYTIVTPDLFQTKHRFRVFELCFVFLKSPHVPSYILASFVKKFSRLSLSAPSSSCLFILAIVHNLLRRNPSIRCLQNRPNPTVAGLSTDVFVESERDLTETRALESSLWEVKSLTSHYCPRVAILAKRLVTTENWPRVDWDLQEFATISQSDLFQDYCTKKAKNCAFAVAKPTSMFSSTSSFVLE